MDCEPMLCIIGEGYAARACGESKFNLNSAPQTVVGCRSAAIRARILSSFSAAT
ncbi:hypothetical protein DFP91_5443 [Pseudorhodoplanes sinuspersici]|nr:hypothetical protein DFP91_5443 [Pseudorhodoplanes sinuspersici]